MIAWKPFGKKFSLKQTKILKKIQIQPRFYFYLALMLLLVPIRWITAILLAAIIHEFGHYFIIIAFGAPINCIRIDLGGVVIESDFRNTVQELLCAAGGPIFSILTLLLSRNYPELAICACSQTMFNALPIPPLDGGRIMSCLLSLLLPGEFADKVINVISVTCLTALFCLSVIFVIKKVAWIVPLVAMITAVRKYRKNKNSLQR